jgi:hypothetical protein
MSATTGASQRADNLPRLQRYFQFILQQISLYYKQQVPLHINTKQQLQHWAHARQQPQQSWGIAAQDTDRLILLRGNLVDAELVQSFMDIFARLVLSIQPACLRNLRHALRRHFTIVSLSAAGQQHRHHEHAKTPIVNGTIAFEVHHKFVGRYEQDRFALLSWPIARTSVCAATIFTHTKVVSVRFVGIELSITSKINKQDH